MIVPSSIVHTLRRYALCKPFLSSQLLTAAHANGVLRGGAPMAAGQALLCLLVIGWRRCRRCATALLLILLIPLAAQANGSTARATAGPLEFAVEPLQPGQPGSYAANMEWLHLQLDVCEFTAYCHSKRRSLEGPGPYPLTQQSSFGAASIDGTIADSRLGTSLSATVQRMQDDSAWDTYGAQHTLAHISIDLSPQTTLTISRRVEITLGLDDQAGLGNLAVGDWWLMLYTGSDYISDSFTLSASDGQPAFGEDLLSVSFRNTSLSPVELNLTVYGNVYGLLPAVPEPAGLPLLAGGLLLLAFCGRLRRRGRLAGAILAASTLVPASAAVHTIDLGVELGALTAHVRPIAGGPATSSTIAWASGQQTLWACEPDDLCEITTLYGRVDALAQFAADAQTGGAHVSTVLRHDGGLLATQINLAGDAQGSQGGAYFRAYGTLELAPHTMAHVSAPVSLRVHPLLPSGTDYRAMAKASLDLDAISFESSQGSSADLSRTLGFDIYNDSNEWRSVPVEFSAMNIAFISLVPEPLQWQMAAAGALLLAWARRRQLSSGLALCPTMIGQGGSLRP